MGEPAGGFLRENKPAAELWYSVLAGAAIVARHELRARRRG
ncbi:exported SurF1 family protein [Bordetella pertussis]|nr:exported SurF1 family protein [Bordetella pertussis]